MATVILGGGIIGTATAYYLAEWAASKNASNNRPPPAIHVVEASSQRFASASGYAGGFIARDWFSPAVASLGAVSFDLHRTLAREHNGNARWGYASSTAVSLSIASGEDGRAGQNGSGERDEDWLQEGTSRSTVSGSVALQQNAPRIWRDDDGTPAWVTKQRGGSLDTISSPGGCAQVEPLQLCEFLMSECQQRGVQLHMSSRATAVVKNGDDCVSGVRMFNSSTKTSTIIPCQNIVLAAGAWTPAVFSTLFPSSSLKIPIDPLAGHSIVIHSPRQTIPDEDERRESDCFAVFCAPGGNWAFAPEAISRVGRDGTAEIYVAGLNRDGAELPLPEPEIVGKQLANEDDWADARRQLKKATVQLAGRLSQVGGVDGVPEDDLEVVREGLCYRPVAKGGSPIIAELPRANLGSGVGLQPGSGVFVAAGHGPWGISLSLGTGKVVSEMVRGLKGRDLCADVDGLGLR